MPSGSSSSHERPATSRRYITEVSHSRRFRLFPKIRSEANRRAPLFFSQQMWHIGAWANTADSLPHAHLTRTKHQSVSPLGISGLVIQFHVCLIVISASAGYSTPVRHTVRVVPMKFVTRTCCSREFFKATNFPQEMIG